MPELAKLDSGSVVVPELRHLDDVQRISICEALDRILNKGAVVVGEVTISVADVDLVYLGLQVVLTSIETAREAKCRAPRAGPVIDVSREESNAVH